jgi:RecA/RadA recombinase
MLNKNAGLKISHNLSENNPTDVDDWIPTGSTWLDSIICKGKYGGIPVGKVTELAGLESTGKSYMAAQIASNAQKMGIDVVYFDSESAIDSTFLEKIGCDVGSLIYYQATTVENVLETIETLLTNTENRWLFIWDSLALTPPEGHVEKVGDFNPLSSMALKARILAKGMSKLVIPLSNQGSTLLVLNQLKTNITSNIAEKLTTPYVTPGGKAMIYSYSLRIWLTGRKAKASFVLDENGFRIGSEVKVELKKSRFGTQGRKCTFKILWGSDEIGILNDESLFEALSPHLPKDGTKFYIDLDGQRVKFFSTGWNKFMEDEKFRTEIYRLTGEVLIEKFDLKEGSASDFYELEGEDE